MRYGHLRVYAPLCKSVFSAIRDKNRQTRPNRLSKDESYFPIGFFAGATNKRPITKLTEI